MEVYKFRVLIDTEDDVFRDIEIRSDQTFEDLHHAIIKAYGFFGDQMTSFYVSNDNWDKGQEIVLLDMGFDEKNAPPQMSTTIVSDMISEVDQKLIYVYDFLRMWIFYIELINLNKSPELVVNYPRTVLEYGTAPKESSKEIPDIGVSLSDPLADFGDDGMDDDEMGDMFDSLEDHDLSDY